MMDQTLSEMERQGDAYHVETFETEWDLGRGLWWPDPRIEGLGEEVAEGLLPAFEDGVGMMKTLADFEVIE